MRSARRRGCEIKPSSTASPNYYLILREGWDGARRIHGPVVSLEIIGGEVWLQADNTDLRIAERLEKAGISRNDITLGLQPPSVRPYTEYAVA